MTINCAAFEQSGFAVVPHVLPPAMVGELIDLTQSEARTTLGKGGVRNLLDVPEFRALADSVNVRSLAEQVLGDGAFVVRGIFFDKTAETNWKVPWHQDVTIAVTNRIEVDEYGPWSVKAGVTHVQPPRRVLESMASIRLHLDDCPADNGALRVIPGTHKNGKLPQVEIDGLVAKLNATTCEITCGGALMMRPLLLHASSASVVPRHRRVIHYDYARVDLDGGLKWLERH